MMFSGYNIVINWLVCQPYFCRLIGCKIWRYNFYKNIVLPCFCKRELCYDLQNTCTISFPANHTISGIYAVAVSMEDFPKSTINIGSKIYTPSNKLSTVSLQVIYKLIDIKIEWYLYIHFVRYKKSVCHICEWK